MTNPTARALDVAALRSHFPSLASGAAHFDGPGGSQTPAVVGAAMAHTLTGPLANRGTVTPAERNAEAAVVGAREALADFLGADPGGVVFGRSMTELTFHLARTLAKDWGPGDEVVVTRLDHDGNVSPWLELAHDLGLTVELVDVNDDTTLDYADLERKLDERTRVVAFPLASNAVGTTTDAERIVAAAHSVGALAWADAVHYGPHGPIDVAELGVDVLLCSPYKFFGPHLGLAFVRASLTERWRTYKVRPADHPYETGTLPHELLAGFAAAVEYVESIGWTPIRAHERALGQRFLDGVPGNVTLYGLPTMDGRVPTFAFTVEGRSPRAVAERLAEREIAVWDGNYYAVEIMARLGLGEEGAVRAGFVHYNTAAEVDRLLAALGEL